jgi:predicted glycogen debranching enzyme
MPTPGDPGIALDRATEWLEADGLGGFASGTTAGVNTRRYHALLLAALNPPADRHVFVNDAVVWLETPHGNLQVSRHRYAPDLVTGAQARLVGFRSEPWPIFTYEVGDLRLTREIIMRHGAPLTLSRWRLERGLPGLTLCVRPLLSGRGFHALHEENPDFGRERSVAPGSPAGERTWFVTYPSLPRVLSLANAAYRHDPDWYRRFAYEREQQRGLDAFEDLASPGILRFDLSDPIADWIVALDTPEVAAIVGHEPARVLASELREREFWRRKSFHTPLERAGDAYLVKRGTGMTILAGYPWFGDWGRDTFIALRGLCFATGRLREAAEILLGWSNVVSRGMLPNRFPDSAGEAPEYNSVDAALWYAVCVGELLSLQDAPLSGMQRRELIESVRAIVRGHLAGTRHGIAVDTDGLLRAGEPGVQLTWMDAKIGDWVVTQRSGKPVEVEALWLNALSLMERFTEEFRPLLHKGLASFQAKFDNGAGGLFDVVDVNHERGKVDASVRPNQVFAVGGLPLSLLPRQRCRQVLDLVERELWTPLGLRSLSPMHRDYAPHYQGGPAERDAVYHQGTVWPWLAGPFIEAWVKAHGGRGLGDDAQARDSARERFFEPLLEHLTQAGVGHVSEIADGVTPHTPRGCPFQAWSVGELLRVERLLAGDSASQHDDSADAAQRRRSACGA